MTKRVVVASLAAGALLVMGCSINWRPGSKPAPAPVVSAQANPDTADVVQLLRDGTKFVDETSFRADVDIAGQILTLVRTDNVKKRAEGRAPDALYPLLGLPS